MRILSRWLYVLTLAAALLFAWAEPAHASKSRASKSSASKSSASKKVSRSQKASRGKASRARAAKSKSKSRKEKLSRRGKRGRERQASRARRSRRYARRQQYEPQETAAPAASRSVASGIPTERVIEIQNALVKAGYLDAASGQYDDQTIEAMKQFQADNALTQTGFPSAHTLKKLGVSKRSNDGYAIPVKSDKKSSAQEQSGASA